ncbi:HTH-type transcriptional repressor AseR [Sporomusa ovata DSM 2662]|uniref:Transcriptional regulator, ArsR family n=1 Tax=Sporomusa ovata TaxID=2378 RepID=A0A0U1L121_9FIRM|nr:metalloregulator ArsR/SmtB family transcription factor [Sporomusa ovata]EQB29170.1 transcriptional regulator, ArsR family [Sporomusa ovata DSM 2662]CQR72604.1 transcriptional regulator, ArsR family [Sporomusa ovata]
MQDHLKEMAVVLKALGDEKRLKIIKMLASNSNETFCVSDVALQLGISQPAASQHIKVLKNIGILEENRKGFRVFYTINSDVLKEYRKEINELFRKAFEKCQYNFSCDQCSYNNKCK